jgi:hypothetical protein
MRTKRPVIAWTSLPPRLPLAGPLAIGLLLDRISAPAWMWYAAGTLVSLWWLAVIVSWGQIDPIDVAQGVRDLATVILSNRRDVDEWPEAVKTKKVEY